MKKIKILAYMVAMLVLATAVSALPDLTISNIQLTPDSPCLGEDIVITFDVNNIGNQAASNFDVGVYNSGTMLTSVAGISVNAYSSKKVAAVILANSNMNLNLRADPYYIITENDENNNIKAYGGVFPSSCSSIFNDATLRRFYKSSIKDHFYTINISHANNAIVNGYVEETSQGKVSRTWFSGSIPLYKMYHISQEIHYYTTQVPQIQGPLSQGFVMEGIEGYMYSNSATGRTPLYHLYHNTNTDHLYTISSDEKQNAITSYGFVDQGTVGYVKGTDPSTPPPVQYELAVQDIWIESCVAGEPTRFWVNVANFGQTTSDTITVKYYIDNIYKGESTIAGLAYDSAATRNIVMIAPEGNHEYKAVVEVNDGDNSNNQRIEWFDVPPPAPALPAPKPASFSDSNPSAGDSIIYSYTIDAVPMDMDYRSMVHFVDDSENIIINDDHWFQDIAGYGTSSPSFSGTKTYTRNILIPSSFPGGRLRMVVGFYDIADPDTRIELDTQYVTDLGFNRYLVGEINVAGNPLDKPAPMAADFSNTNPEVGEQITYTINIDAVPMDKDYRTFVHFLDSDDGIILNDDHWIQDDTGFGTGSASFNGQISYQRDVTIPFDISAGTVRIAFGYYSYDNNIEGDRVELSTRYVPEINWFRYNIGEITVHGDSVDYYQLPATSGKISWFASDAGDSCKTTRSTNPDCSINQNVCGAGGVYGVDECCNSGTYAHYSAWLECLGEPYGEVWYVAMRWPYADAPESVKYDVKSWWHNRKIKVTNPSNGKAVILAAKDWGPNEATGRVIDVSKRAMQELGAVTDNNVQIEFADQGAPLGPVVETTPYPLSGKVIVLDPGHGDGYPGASGADGEAEAAHGISTKLKGLLESLGATVFETPSNYDVNQRATFANNNNADVFLSIHFNGGDASVTGVESFYGAQNYAAAGGSSTNDIAFCEKVVPEVKNILGSTLRGTDGIKPDTDTAVGSLAVLRYTNMPACLVEMEFISAVKEIIFKLKPYSNYKDLFLSEDYQNEAATSLKRAVLDYFGYTEEGITKPAGGFEGDGDQTYSLADTPVTNACIDHLPVDYTNFKGFVTPLNHEDITTTVCWACPYTTRGDPLEWVKYAGRHPGWDIISSDYDVSAFADGKVIFTGAIGSWGNVVILLHENVPSLDDWRVQENITSIYAHLASINVNKDEYVNAGEKIGVMGGSGGWAVHLHFQIEKDTNLIPEHYPTPKPSWVVDSSPFVWDGVYRRWNLPEKLEVYLENSGPGAHLYSASNYNHPDHPEDMSSDYPRQDLDQLTIDPVEYIHKYPHNKWFYTLGDTPDRQLVFFMKHPTGTVVKVAGENNMYYVDDGKLRLIPLFQYLKENGLKVSALITPLEFLTYEIDPIDLTYPDGTMFIYNDRYYIISGKEKYEFIKGFFNLHQPYVELGYEYSQFIRISQEAFDSIPYGGEIRNGAEHPAGSYVYNTNDGQYYLIDGSDGQKIMHPIYLKEERENRGLEELEERGQWEKSSIALAVDKISYPVGERLSLRSGTLVKPATERSIYLVDENRLRWIYNESTFFGLGYSFDQIVELSDRIFTTLPFDRREEYTIQVDKPQINSLVYYDDSSAQYKIIIENSGQFSSAEIEFLDGDYNPVGDSYVPPSGSCMEVELSYLPEARYVRITTSDAMGGYEEYIESLGYINSEEKFRQEIDNDPLNLEINLSMNFQSEGNTAFEDEGVYCVDPDVFVDYPGKIKICPGTYSQKLIINSSNVFIDLSGVTFEGPDSGIYTTSGYTFSNLQQDIKGAKPEYLTDENIEDHLDQIPLFHNITIINGIFRNSEHGINISTARNLKIINNTFENVENPIAVVAADSEVSGNSITNTGTSQGNGILFAGAYNTLESNSVEGDYEYGIMFGALNSTADSNIITGSKKGLAALGLWNEITNNNVIDTEEALIGFVLGQSLVAGNRLDTNSKGMQMVCSSENIINNNIITSSDYRAIHIGNFFGGDCSFNNTISENCLIDQEEPGMYVVKEPVNSDGVVKENQFLNNAYSETEAECQEELDQKNRFSNPDLWQHEYNIIYEPGELRQISGVEFASNLLTEWDSIPMEIVDGYHYIGFDSPLQGERVFNIKYNVDSVGYDYFAITTQGLAGNIYINGHELGCDYSYYIPDYSANYKVIIEGNGEFSNPEGEKLEGCDQLCSEEKLNQRVSWTGAELYVPGAVFTGNCYVNGTLEFDCPVVGKDTRVSGAFDSWAASVGFTADADRSGTTGSMHDIYIASESWRQEDGLTIFYPEGEYAYWLDVNHCHPDVILEGWAHHILPP
ncbi:N-acetylmuramoyl-L-alanine amidase [candidate division KSB1 bacterium]